MKIVSKDVWEMFVEMYQSYKKQISTLEELTKTQEDYIRLLKDDNRTYRDILNGRYVKKELVVNIPYELIISARRSGIGEYIQEEARKNESDSNNSNNMSDVGDDKLD